MFCQRRTTYDVLIYIELTLNINIIVGEQTISATMEDNGAARDFLSRLPLEVTLEDYNNGTEKIFYPDPELSLDDTPRGCTPVAGDITIYEPWGNVAIFCRDWSESNSLIKIGHIALLLLGLLSCGGTEKETHQSNITETGKQNLGSVLALYPKPMTVIGAEVYGKVNWLVVGHTGIIGHDRILVSMSKSHYTNQGIRETKRLSVNLVSREMLSKADYVGSVSGASVDKSEVFAYHWGENGTPVIDASPLAMECDVVDIYETEDFDNFVCSIANTYAAPEVLDADGKLDYTRLKPVLFEFPTYSYIATGEIIGKCLNLDKQPGMCAKQQMTASGIVRLSKVEVYPQYLDEYVRYATEVGEISLRTEPGVLTMYAVSEKENPCQITILETYASREAYDKHIASAHFQKYKQGTLHMVKSLELTDQSPLNPANRINNFME